MSLKYVPASKPLHIYVTALSSRIGNALSKEEKLRNFIKDRYASPSFFFFFITLKPRVE